MEADVSVSLAQRHPSTKAVVQACIARMRKQETTHDKLIQRRLRAFYDSRDAHVWFHDVLVPPGSPAPVQY
jgi:hypothetical protein